MNSLKRTDLIPWLNDNSPFPPVEQALRSPNGLLAAGGGLSETRLLEAYRHGIFPWFNPGEPILWWSPDPRMVLIPGEFKTSRSLKKVLRNRTYQVRTDSAFETVMRACAAPRGGHQGGGEALLAEPADFESSRPAAPPAPEGSASPYQGGTWIGEDMIAAYCALNRLGYAHSVEVWMDRELSQFHFEGQGRRRRPIDTDSAISTARSEGESQNSFTDEMELVGGLYGVSIGRMFYGESMFSLVSNASKIALAHLARQLDRWQFGMIDCQMNTPHLASLGAREISRREFIARLQELVHCAPIADWEFDTDLFT
jgi:leucyl/phenylalanyl-tRNA---protein transferase